MVCMCVYTYVNKEQLAINAICILYRCCMTAYEESKLSELEISI